MATQLQAANSGSTVGPTDLAFYASNIMTRPQFRDEIFDMIQSKEMPGIMRTLEAFYVQPEVVMYNQSFTWFEQGYTYTGINIGVVTASGTGYSCTVANPISGSNYAGQVGDTVFIGGNAGRITSRPAADTIFIEPLDTTRPLTGLINGCQLGVFSQVQNTGTASTTEPTLNNQVWEPYAYSQGVNSIQATWTLRGDVLGVQAWSSYKPWVQGMTLKDLPAYNSIMSHMPPQFAISAEGTFTEATWMLFKTLSIATSQLETDAMFGYTTTNTAITSPGFAAGYDGILNVVQANGQNATFPGGVMTLSQWATIKKRNTKTMYNNNSFFHVAGQDFGNTMQLFLNSQTNNVNLVQTVTSTFQSPVSDYAKARAGNGSMEEMMALQLKFGWNGMKILGMEVNLMTEDYTPFFHPGIIGNLGSPFDNYCMMVPTQTNNIELYGGRSNAAPSILFAYVSNGGSESQTIDGFDNGALKNVRKFVVDTSFSNYAGGYGNGMNNTLKDQIGGIVRSQYTAAVLGARGFWNLSLN